MISTKNYQELNLDNILKQISSYDIFRYYIHNFKNINESFTSPLREDKNPGVRIFKTKSDDFMYKDFAYNGHTFTGVGFVMEYFRISFLEALQKINEDFNLNLGMKSTSTTKETPRFITKEQIDKIKSYKNIRIVSKPANWFNLLYFTRYHITLKTLEFFKVKPITGYYLNFNYFPCKKNSFAYCFGNYTYKILQTEESEIKWLSNTTSTCMQGYEQLPKTGNICFITSSLKDVMVLHEIGYASIAPQSETPTIEPSIMEDLKNRFNHVIILYDNDKPGKDNARKLSKLYDLDYVYIPNMYQEKDPSDFAKKQGLQQLKIVIESII